ncbi:MAG: tetratricopeptide repeat protein [Candidatus Melainabacteria bacterium]|nr:tetratricopeptide repeat protein [Candidatus Melainabacteria bacterium]
MSSFFKKMSGNARFGDLLVQAGLLSPNQLQEAMTESRNKKLQIGQVLVMSGALSSKDLQMVLEAQSMLRDKSIDINLAVQCIKVARKIGSSFADALQDYDESLAKKARTGKLGELLVEAGIINEEQLSNSMEQSVNTGMPLGRVLVLNRAIPSEALQGVLDIQVKLRDEMMTREEALLALRNVTGLSGEVPEQKAEDDKPKKSTVRLGELLVMAGILTENDVMDALEWGLANQQPIGNVLVNQNLISKDLLDAALFFQDAVRENKIDALKACECLSEVFSTGASPQEVLDQITEHKPSDEPGAPPIDYRRLLTMARVVTDDQIDCAYDQASHTASLIGKILVLTGSLDVPTLQASLRCYQMISKGWLTPDDGIAALDYCLHQNPTAPIPFEQALRDLGWNPDKGLSLKGEAPEAPPKVLVRAGTSAQEHALNAEAQSATSAMSISGSNAGSAAGSTAGGSAPPPVEPKVEAKPEPKPEPELKPEPEIKPEPKEEPKVEAKIAEPEPEPELRPEPEIKPEPKEEPKVESKPEPKEEDHKSEGGLKALLFGLDEADNSEQLPEIIEKERKSSGRLASLVSKPAETKAPAEENKPEPAPEPEPVKAEEKKAPEPISESVSEPVAASKETATEKENEEIEDLSGMSAEDLLSKILKGGETPSHMEHGNKKRPGRFSETILPEAAKARQLASLISKESAYATEKFDKGGEDTDALGTAFLRLAERHFEQGNYKDAQVIYERVLVHKLNDLGPESPELVEDYNNLALVLSVQGLFDKAEPFMRRAVSLYESAPKVEPLPLADYLHSLGTVYFKLNKFSEAEEVYRRVLELRRENLSDTHQDIGRTLVDYAKVVKQLGQTEKAEAIYKKAQEILKTPEP